MFLITPETLPFRRAASFTQHMLAKEYRGCAWRTDYGKEAAVELQGRIHRVSCKRIPDTSVISAQPQLYEQTSFRGNQ